MIKINLLAEKKQAKPRSASGGGGGGMKVEGVGGGQNLLLVGLLLIGVVVAGGWWWTLSSRTEELARKHADADVELQRLAEIRKKGDEYKKQKDLLARKIDLITELKKQQAVPVHILDQVSKQLPEFLWLESMTANNNTISISGKGTTYNAVTNFYNNLTGSGFFSSVTLGRTFEVQEGVAFSLTCKFSGLGVGDPAAPSKG